MNDDSELIAGNTCTLADYRATHFQWRVADRVGTVTLNRPERKNPLTFASYAELRDLFGRLKYASDVTAIVIHGAGDNFCSGGDVHEIIGPLVKMKAPELLMFTRMTGDLVKTMRPSSPPSTAFAPAPAPSSRWPPTCAWAPHAARPLSSSTAWAWPAATWARARSCRA